MRFRADRKVYKRQLSSIFPIWAIATVHYHLDKVAKEQPEKAALCQMIKESLYVDDLIAGADNDNEAILLRKNVSQIFQEM